MDPAAAQKPWCLDLSKLPRNEPPPCQGVSSHFTAIFTTKAVSILAFCRGWEETPEDNARGEALLCLVDYVLEKKSDRLKMREIVTEFNDAIRPILAHVCRQFEKRTQGKQAAKVNLGFDYVWKLAKMKDTPCPYRLIYMQAKIYDFVRDVAPFAPIIK